MPVENYVPKSEDTLSLLNQSNVPTCLCLNSHEHPVTALKIQWLISDFPTPEVSLWNIWLYNYITIYVYKLSYPTIYLGQKQLYPTVFYISFMEHMGYKTSRISGYTTTV